MRKLVILFIYLIFFLPNTVFAQSCSNQITCIEQGGQDECVGGTNDGNTCSSSASCPGGSCQEVPIIVNRWNVDCSYSPSQGSCVAGCPPGITKEGSCSSPSSPPPTTSPPPSGGGGGGDTSCGDPCNTSSDCGSGWTCDDTNNSCVADDGHCGGGTDEKVRIKGFVYNCSGSGVGGVKVQVFDQTTSGDSAQESTTTSSDGSWELVFEPGGYNNWFHLRAGSDAGGSGSYKAQASNISTKYGYDQNVPSGSEPNETQCLTINSSGWVTCDPGDETDRGSWWHTPSNTTGNFNFVQECNQAPTCSLSGSTTTQVGQSASYTIYASDPDGNFNYSQMKITPTNNSSGWIQSGGNITSSGTTRTWTCQTPGTYYLVCNAVDTAGAQCTGNPWCDGTISSCSGWSNCGGADRLTVTCAAPAAYCPDGSVNQSFEECDDGNTNNSDSCVSCKNARCGDGHIRTGVEECDDGNTANGDGCNSSCQFEAGPSIDPSPDIVNCGQSCSSSSECQSGQTCSSDNICELNECLGKSCACSAYSCGGPCKNDLNCKVGNYCDPATKSCKVAECVGESCTCTPPVPTLTLSVVESCNSWGDPKPTLSWSSVSGAPAYRVFRNAEEGIDPTWIPPGGIVNSRSYTDTTAFGNNQSIHNYRVRAYDGNANPISAYSNTVTVANYRCPVACDPNNNWNPWGSCSLSCGGGTQYRTNNCAGVPPESRSCNAQSCCNNSSWSSWSNCSVSCGGGTQTRTNGCGEVETRSCNTQSCCDSSDWGSWTSCSVSCGGGTQSRTNDCGDVESRSCNTQSCCVPDCSGFQCGQFDGCGGVCSGSDDVCNFSPRCGQANVCNTTCSNNDDVCNFSPRCGQTNTCGTTCSNADNGSPGTINTLSPSTGTYRVTSNEVNISWSAPSDGLADEYELKIYPTGAYANPDAASCSSSQVECITRSTTNYNHDLDEDMGIDLTIAVRAVNTTCDTDEGDWLEREINLVQDITGNFYLDNGGASQGGIGICAGGGSSSADINTSSSITASTGGSDSLSSTGYSISDVPYSPASWSSVKNTVTLTLFNTYHSANTNVCACPSNGDLYTCEYEQIHSPQNNVNFYVSTHDLSNDPWWQSRGGLVYSGTNLDSEIPDTCDDDPSCSPYLITQEFVSSSDAAYNALSAGIPIVGSGTINTNGTAYSTERSPKARVEGSTQDALSCEGYDILSKKIDLSSVQTLAGTITSQPSGTIIDAEENIAVAVAQSSLTIAPESGDAWNISAGETLLIFVADNLTIEDPENLGQLFTVEEGGFLGFIVKNNLQFDDSVGYDEANITEDEANVAGVFIADTITVRGANSDTTIDKRFLASGSLVACNQVAFQRDYDNLSLGREYNATIPTETVQFRPDFTRNFPNVLKKSNLVWQEVN